MVPNPKSQIAANVEITFSIIKVGLCVSVFLNIIDIMIIIRKGRKLGYAMSVETRYEITEKLESKHEILDLDRPNHKDN